MSQTFKNRFFPPANWRGEWRCPGDSQRATLSCHDLMKCKQPLEGKAMNLSQVQQPGLCSNLALWQQALAIHLLQQPLARLQPGNPIASRQILAVRLRWPGFRITTEPKHTQWTQPSALKKDGCILMFHVSVDANVLAHWDTGTQDNSREQGHQQGENVFCILTSNPNQLLLNAPEPLLAVTVN